jgi:hypothetical protein
MEEEVLKHQKAEWKHLADIEKIRQAEIWMEVEEKGVRKLYRRW